MNVEKCLVAVLLVFATCLSPVWAASRSSASILVSCTILPALEISTAPVQESAAPSNDWLQAPLPAPTARNELAIASQNRRVVVNTNLGNQYNFTQQTIKNPAGGIARLYSVTAL